MNQTNSPQGAGQSFFAQTIRRAAGLATILGVICPLPLLLGQTVTPPPGVGVDQRIGEPLPLNLPFRDEHGKTQPLGAFFQQGKPVVVAPAYFECAQLCTFVFNGLVKALAETKDLAPGRDYVILSVSINPRDDPAMAMSKGNNYRNAVKPGGVVAGGWLFLTGSEESIRRLTGALGYRYQRSGKEFAHPAVIVFVMPDGRISRYLPGPNFPSRDFRLALVEASRGSLGSPMDAVLLTCFRYDSATGRYAPYSMGFVRIGSAATLLVLVGTVVWLRRRSRNP